MKFCNLKKNICRGIVLSLLLVSFGDINAQIVINEIVSSNLTGLTDEDGDFPDWIEVFNNGDQALSLNNYFLTDDLTDTTKWGFPDMNIGANEHLLVFASGKDRSQKVMRWSTLIDKGDEFHYIVPEEEIGDAWRSLGFDVQNWQTGASGFGYGDNDDETVLEGIESIFVRKEFTIDALSEVEQLILHMDYDDGFVAFINGVEVARDNLGTAGTDVSYQQKADDYNHEAGISQGLEPDMYEIRNWDGILKQGENVLAIQVHNFSNTSSDLTCIPFLSVAYNSVGASDISDLITLPVSYLHTNFKVKANGEALYLFENKTFIDSVGAVSLLSDISLGRSIDNPNEWLFFNDPTPRKANLTNGIAEISIDSIVFSHSGGVYSSGISLELSMKSGADAHIYYSTDGSVPTTASQLYTESISISDVQVIRAKAFIDGALPSPVQTHTYLINKNHNVPIVSLSTNPENLWDYQTGIYEMGPNANPDNPHHGANFWQDWERPVNFEFYDVNGDKQINQVAGIKIYGAYSRAHPQKSFALYARKEYGDGAFNHRFFTSRENDKFEALVLRNAGNAFYNNHLRDAFMTDLVSEGNFEYQAYQPTAVYLNGEYWGVLNLREKINEHFISDNTGADADEVNVLGGNAEVIEGNNARYIDLKNFIANNSLKSDENYDYVTSLIDIDCFIDYYVVQTYFDNRDWPGNNIKYWNTNSTRSMYRWILYDTDFGFGLYGNENYKYNTLEDASASNGPFWPNPPWSTLLFRKLLENNEFKNAFAIRASDWMNTTFKSDVVNNLVNSFKSEYEQEMVSHCIRWDLDYNNWKYQVDRMKTFGQNRAYYYKNDLKELLGLTDTYSVVVDVNNETYGGVRLNSLKLTKLPFTGSYFNNLMHEIEALPKPGYKLGEWRGNSNSTQAKIKYYSQEDASFQAVFVPAEEEDYDVIINEIFYNSIEGMKPSDWVEIYNNGTATVDLNGWTLSDANADSAYVFNQSYHLYPNQYLVICKNKENFKTCYPYVKNVIGEFRFGLSSNGDYLRLYDDNGALIDAVDYYTNGSWPTEANGGGASVEVINPDESNVDAGNWMASLNGGTPGGPYYEEKHTSIFNPTTDLNAGLSCYPNPFDNHAEISFSIHNQGSYTIELIAIDGRVIKQVNHQYYTPGNYQLELSRSDIGAIAKGLYLIQLRSDLGVESIKIVIQ